MRNALICALAAMLLCASTITLAQQGDQRILAARDALRAGDRVKLERLAVRSEKHVLDPYVRYWLLINKLARPDPAPSLELNDFLNRHAGSVMAERLQAAWLSRMATEGDWHAYLKLYAAHDNPDAELGCRHLQARYLTGDVQVLDEVVARWPEFASAPHACLPVIQATAESGKAGADRLWWHFRRQIDSRDVDRAATTLKWLPRAQAKGKSMADKELAHLRKSPAAYIDRLPPNFAVTRRGRELALAALVRLARQDPLAAYARFTRLSDRLNHDERNYVYAVLGHHGALAQLPEAVDWYRAAGDIPLTAEQRAWRIRTELRAMNWRHVARLIEALPESERIAREWTYWLARAHSEQGHAAAAATLYRKVADNVDFYGLLAAEELGRQFEPPRPDAPVSPRDLARARGDAAVQRAFALYRLDLRTEGMREWFMAVRNRDAGFLVAAAHLALGEGLYDRAINTAELADPRANFHLRFIAPYRDKVEPQVLQQGLDMAWVYGVMRQESRFVVPARSSAGAQGLMQVMPATGKWVAKQIGLRGYHPRQLSDPAVNVKLGTSYMRLILGDLDNHPVLASAGYNAGPSRARRWRHEQPIEAAIYVETIPIDETRDYVKKVLANAVVYAALFDKRPQSIKARLRIIEAAPSQ